MDGSIKKIKYVKDGNSIDMLATIGLTEFHNADGHFRSRDFILLNKFFKFNGESITPECGDFIYETTKGAGVRYKVSAPITEPVFRYADPHKKALRIHTVESDPIDDPKYKSCDACGEEPCCSHVLLEQEYNRETINSISTQIDNLKKQQNDLEKTALFFKGLYYELTGWVGNKYKGESRHDTALRYIKEAERQEWSEEKKAK